MKKNGQENRPDFSSCDATVSVNGPGMYWHSVKSGCLAPNKVVPQVYNSLSLNVVQGRAFLLHREQEKGRKKV